MPGAVAQNGRSQAAMDSQTQTRVRKQVDLKEDNQWVSGLAELVEVNSVVLAFMCKAHRLREGAFAGGREVGAAGRHGRD